MSYPVTKLLKPVILTLSFKYSIGTICNQILTEALYKQSIQQTRYLKENIHCNHLGHKKLIICFSGTARVTFNPPHIKNFYCIPTSKCEKLSTHCKLSVQSGRHTPCLLVSMVGWLAEFWCTRSRDSAPLIKSRKFLRNIVGTSFLFAKGKKK